LNEVLAILPPKQELSLPDALLPKIRERERARKDRNFKLADQLRKELEEAGVVLEDTKDGVRWKIVKKIG
jgi:cysteinyl-tRNA synthetase